MEIDSNKNTSSNDQNIIFQLDGQIDDLSDMDEHSDVILANFGHIECSEVSLFRALTILRGLESYLGNFSDHELCKHTLHGGKTGPCTLCLLRSFVYRINNLKPKAHRSVNPTELNLIIPLIQNMSTFDILDFFMRSIS